MKTIQQQRTQFEAWYTKDDGEAMTEAALRKNKYNEYILMATSSACNVWQACEAIRVTALAEKDAEIARLLSLLDDGAKAINSISSAMITKPDDFSLDRRDAWIYHILFNWGEFFSDIAVTHKWDDATRIRAERYRKTIEKIKALEQTS